MNLLKLKKPAAAEPVADDLTTQDTPLVEAAEVAPVEKWTRGRSLARRGTSAAIMGALLCGPAAAGVLLWDRYLAPVPVQIQSSGAPTTLVDERARAGLYGRDVVVMWLTAVRGQERLLTSWLPPASNTVLPEKAPSVSDPVVASTDQVAPHQWAVRVAVTIDGQRRYLQLPVLFDPAIGSATGLALPQPVGATPVGDLVQNPLTVQVSTSTDLGQMLAGFVSAFAAGQGDITRYISPGAPIMAIQPAPYQSVRLVSLASDVSIPTNRAPREGGTAQVLVVAQATDAKKRVQTVSWVLTVRARATLWEVASVDAVPGVRTGAPTAASAVSTPQISAAGPSSPSTPK